MLMDWHPRSDASLSSLHHFWSALLWRRGMPREGEDLRVMVSKNFVKYRGTGSFQEGSYLPW